MENTLENLKTTYCLRKFEVHLRKYYIESLGCPKNLVDSELINGILHEAGMIITTEPEDAEIIIVNTCAFIQEAKEETILTIFELLEYKETGKCDTFIVTGCFVKRYADNLKEEIEEVDHIVQLKDFEEIKNIVNLKKESVSRKLLGRRETAYLRISDGCENYCTYCSIPSIRGKLQSETESSLVSEAERLVSEGVKELIITAQDIMQYGRDKKKEDGLVHLLEKLNNIDGLEWIRLMYMHPANIYKGFFHRILHIQKVCHYFDIPLQHCNNEILKLMNRKTTKEQLVSMIDELRTEIPDAVIRTTFIVGFPGEKRKYFNELKRFIEEIRFDKVGIFAYSEEEDTPAADFEEKISRKTAEKRKDELMMIQQEISASNLESFVGRTIEVLIEEEGNGEFKYLGRSEYDAPEIDGYVYILEGNANIGDIVNVHIDESWNYDLAGRIVG